MWLRNLWWPLRGCLQTTLTSFWLFWPPKFPSSVDTFYLINVDKKSTFLDHLPPRLVNVVCERPLSKSWSFRTPNSAFDEQYDCPNLTATLGPTCENFSKRIGYKVQASFGFTKSICKLLSCSKLCSTYFTYHHSTIAFYGKWLPF